MFWLKNKKLSFFLFYSPFPFSFLSASSIKRTVSSAAMRRQLRSNLINLYLDLPQEKMYECTLRKFSTLCYIHSKEHIWNFFKKYAHINRFLKLTLFFGAFKSQICGIIGNCNSKCMKYNLDFPNLAKRE